MFYVSLTDSLHKYTDDRVNAYTCSIQIIGDQATAKEPGNGNGRIQSQRPNVTLRIFPSHSNFLPAHFPFHREWSPTWGHVSCTPPPPGFIKHGGQSTLLIGYKAKLFHDVLGGRLAATLLINIIPVTRVTSCSYSNAMALPGLHSGRHYLEQPPQRPPLAEECIAEKPLCTR